MESQQAVTQPLNPQPGQPATQIIQTIYLPPVHRVSHYKAKAARGLAITQLTAGIICILCAITTFFVSWANMSTANTGSGFWNGLLYMVAGGIGIASSRNKFKGYIIGFMVLSIVASIFAAALLILACMDFFVDTSNMSTLLATRLLGGGRGANVGNEVGGMVIDSILLIVGFVEMVVAIASSAICCQAVCCGASGSSQPVQYMAGQPAVYIQHSGNQVYMPTTQPLQPGYCAQPAPVAMAPPGYSEQAAAAGGDAPPLPTKE